MNTYRVDIYQAGRKIAEITLEAIDALPAIWQAEKMVKACQVKVSLGDEQIRWNGLCCEARRLAA